MRVHLKKMTAWALFVCASYRLTSQAPATELIRRLNGTTMTTQEAEAFAKKTLDAAHVTGAEIAVINRGKLVWSAAFGLRRKDPSLPMDRETTT